MRSFDSYSELECLVLGFIALGATSGYAMRKAMRAMRGNKWSVESGSVYRALHRLQQDQLVRERARLGVPNRQRVEFELTQSGQMVLQTWLERTPDRYELEEICDPIRTRSYFLDLLDPSARVQVVRHWLGESKSFVDELKTEWNGCEDTATMQAFGLRSLLMQSEARHDWLKKLLESVKANAPVKERV